MRVFERQKEKPSESDMFRFTFSADPEVESYILNLKATVLR